jgi:hypothetical protein
MIKVLAAAIVKAALALGAFSSLTIITCRDKTTDTATKGKKV